MICEPFINEMQHNFEYKPACMVFDAVYTILPVASVTVNYGIFAAPYGTFSCIMYGLNVILEVFV